MDLVHAAQLLRQVLLRDVGHAGMNHVQDLEAKRPPGATCSNPGSFGLFLDLNQIFDCALLPKDELLAAQQGVVLELSRAHGELRHVW